MRVAEVQAAFEASLLEHGWDVQTDEDDLADVRAMLGAALPVAEVKGVTNFPSTDVDTG